MRRNTHPELKIKLKHSQKFTKFGQKIYMTCSNFQNNNLWESASSCSFGFIFSFIPLALIIVALLTGILKISPGIYNWVMSLVDAVKPFFDVTPFLNNLMENEAVHWVDIVLSIWVIWMARKMFISIMQAMTKIFRSVSKRKTWFNQLFIFVLEFIIVFLIAAVIIAAFIFNRILSASAFLDRLNVFLPSFITRSSHNILALVMYTVIFISTVCVFKVSSGTNPNLAWCIFYGACSTAIFFLLSIFVNKFMNLTNYNVIYGTISTLVILMMKVYFFFVIFLFFAQMIYVTQFFDILLQSQIYLLPSAEENGWLNTLRRLTFINPVALKTKENTLYFKAGEIVYPEGARSDKVYYLRSGTITESSSSQTVQYNPGSFFGDTQCILNQPRLGTAIAETDCKLLFFTAKEFKALMQRSPKAATKAVSKISSETSTSIEEN